ncbi:hypothetical protein DIPPA_25579 [Diplonema papillatum]|nr:hypothetical protein DIPPA_25579 [Diplonema papillatum]
MLGKQKKAAAGSRYQAVDMLIMKRRNEGSADVQTFLRLLPKLAARFRALEQHVNSQNPFLPASANDSATRAVTTPAREATTVVEKKVKKRKLAEMQSNYPPPPAHPKTGEFTARELENLEIAKNLPPLPDNTMLLTELAVLQHESEALGDLFSSITTWVQLIIPPAKVDESNSTEIQRSILKKLSGASQAIRAGLTVEYTDARQSFEENYFDNPRASWFALVECLDKRYWTGLEVAWSDLYKSCFSIYSLLTLNMNTLTKTLKKQRMSYTNM